MGPGEQVKNAKRRAGVERAAHPTTPKYGKGKYNGLVTLAGVVGFVVRMGNGESERL